MSKRTFWKAPDLGIVDEPLALSLLKYRFNKDRQQVPESEANLISSRTESGKHLPILDMDFPFEIVESTTPHHYHILFNGSEISTWRLFAMMIGLYLGRQVELGFLVWTLRRRGNFVRIPGVVKSTEAEKTKPTYGWFFKLKDKM